MKKALLIIPFVIIADQILKFWIKTHMYIGQEIHVFGNWFIIHFTENEGMAFGMKLGIHDGKLILSTFRIIAIIIIGYYLYTLVKKKKHIGLICSISFVFAGALGNMIDSAFYGLVFSESFPWAGNIANFLSHGGGYAAFLHGRVVDMLYFPLIETTFPNWFPIWGGNEFVFFRPVFNIADSSITVGVLLLLIFQKKFFDK